MTGGGSGGHITPILAVASELKRLNPKLKVIYIGQKGDALGDVPAQHPAIDEVHAVRAGKWRRYHGEGLKQLLDVPTLLKNIRDGFYVLLGIWQSWRLLGLLRPQAVFIKGGFVGVPVGLAAALRHIPYVTHDSDAIPGLANRIIARWASLHTVALPKEVYKYPLNKTVTLGIPLAGEFTPVTPGMQKKYRSDLKLPGRGRLLFIIGGGLGAQRVNYAVAEVVPHLLREFSDLQVVHGVGRANEAQMQKLYEVELSSAEQSRVQVKGFISDVYRYSGAADVIITRAGATNLAEFAVQGKACIVVPNPILTGGHQLKNAKYLEAKQAALIVTEPDLEANPNVLAAKVSQLMKDEKLRAKLGAQFSHFAQPQSAKKLATLLLEQAKP